MNANLLLSSILGSILLGLANASSPEETSTSPISNVEAEKSSGSINPPTEGNENVEAKVGYPGLASEVKKIKDLCKNGLVQIQIDIKASNEGKITLNQDEKNTIKFLHEKTGALVEMWHKLSLLLEKKETSLENIKSTILGIIGLETEIIKRVGEFNVTKYLTQEFLDYFEEHVSNHQGSFGDLGTKMADFTGGSLLFTISPNSDNDDLKE